MTKIVTWNVNSVNARLDRVKAFLLREQPDFLCLQELKCTDDKYPIEDIRSVGYHSAVFGVAVLSREPVEVLFKGFDDNILDDAARLITIRSQGLTIISAYVPNGQALGSDKFAYKMEWLKRAKSFLRNHWTPSDNLILVGDFNIAPDDRDVYDPIAWKEHIHCSTPERDALRDVIGFGFIDTFRMHHQEAGLHSWWDYRELSFPKNKGLRIDLIYATPPMAQRCLSARIDRDERKGDKPSDHAPVIAEFSV